ncbi:MAG TPA: RodZ domain-containing protein [Rhodanobacteraceae bacterium]|nr:RodZ domain-containing protein [Rhodanobacteraceae bacterium]
MNLSIPESSGQPSFGQRLRAAREAKGLTHSDIAQRLRLPLRLIGRLEADDYSGMEEGVYLRGYLSSYARLVGVPTVAAETIASQHTHAAPLVATGKVSRSRYLFDRYSVSATYLILTGLIVVPAVWLATHGGLEQNLARTTPLDSPTSIQVPAQTPIDSSATDTAAADLTRNATTDAATPSADIASVAAADAPKQEQPVVASMTPFTSQPAAPAPQDVPASHVGSGAHSMTLKLSQASWVEILAGDGSKLEYGILPAGSERTYSNDKPLSVRLGNAEGAEVKVDGQTVDLAPFRHANVARLRVFGENGAEAPATE